MFKKLLIFASFSLLAVTTAQAQITIYGFPAKYNSKTGEIVCGGGSGACATIPATSLTPEQRSTSTTDTVKKTITVFTKEGKHEIQVQEVKVTKKGEKSVIIFTPKN